VLRFDPPVQQTARVAHAGIEVGGVALRKNQWVITTWPPRARSRGLSRSWPLRHHPGLPRRAPCLLRRHPLLPRLAARSDGAGKLPALAERLPDIRPPRPSPCVVRRNPRGPLHSPSLTRAPRGRSPSASARRYPT
jgi:hypothetical protein